jgi:hypothetical protein
MQNRTSIPITEDVLAEGVRRNSIYCPIAEAIRRALPDATGIRVDLRTIRWSDPQKQLRYIYLTPIAAAQMIVDFDQGFPHSVERLKPFKMRLRDVQIVKTRSREERLVNRGVGTGNAPANKGKPRPRNTTFKVKSDGSITETIGGTPLPVGNPASPANHRRFGARQLKP